MAQNETRTRRNVLAAAVGTAAGAVVVGMSHPLAAKAADSPLLLGVDNAADATTRLAGPSAVTLSVANKTATGFELGGEAVAIATDALNYPALNVVSTNADGALALQVSAPGTTSDLATSTGVKVDAGDNGIIATQQHAFGAGVYGRANGESAVGVHGSAYGATGVAVAGNGKGTATGGYFDAESGTALQVDGKTEFSRSGRASVPANRTYADITVPGGLSASKSSVIATIQAYRPGVAVSCVRLNYPSAGKARIYLTKVASTTHTTPVGWLVID